MVLVASKIAFAHIPKTGGQTIRRIIKNLDNCSRELGTYHSTPISVRDLGISSKFLISIRHPIPWYRSRWYHRIRNGWSAHHPVDWECASNDFNKFVNNVIEYDHDGRFSTIVKMFMKKNDNDCVDYIIKNENLMTEIKEVLESVGYNTSNLLEENINVSGSSEKSSKAVAIYDDSTLNRMLETERWILDNFYDQSQYPISSFLQ
jgi:hypothetical protein